MSAVPNSKVDMEEIICVLRSLPDFFPFSFPKFVLSFQHSICFRMLLVDWVTAEDN